MTPTHLFSSMSSYFDNTVMNTINTGSEHIIATITPLMTACFSIYVLLVMWSYWEGRIDMPINDFLMKVAAWAFVLTCGMNIQFYSEYVVPFFQGLGDQLSAAVTGGGNVVNGLDNLLDAYLNMAQTIWNKASGVQTIEALLVIFLMFLYSAPFMAIAIAYLTLAKFALGVLLALGPLFISAALFPPVRQFFWNWAGQALNYSFLVVLFGAAMGLETNYAIDFISTSAQGLSFVPQTFELGIMGVSFWIIALNLPSIASALAGGVGIATMTGRLGSVIKALAGSGSGFRGGSGGKISGS
jgi:type IV secretion system protein VirB6